MSTPAAPGTRYHYILSVQYEARAGAQRLSWESGWTVPEPGEGRGDVFKRLMDAAEQRGPNPVVLFFSLEPDELPVPAVLNGAGK